MSKSSSLSQIPTSIKVFVFNHIIWSFHIIVYLYPVTFNIHAQRKLSKVVSLTLLEKVGQSLAPFVYNQPSSTLK